MLTEVFPLGQVVDVDPPPHTQEMSPGRLVQSLGPLLAKLDPDG